MTIPCALFRLEVGELIWYEAFLVNIIYGHCFQSKEEQASQEVYYYSIQMALYVSFHYTMGTPLFLYLRISRRVRNSSFFYIVIIYQIFGCF
jgi:hypothetical protein